VSRAYYEVVASRLGMPPEDLEKASLRVFLERRLRLIESRLFELSRRYGVANVEELDRLIQSGGLHEAEAFEGYFEFDNLEAERERLEASLKELA